MQLYCLLFAMSSIHKSVPLTMVGKVNLINEVTKSGKHKNEFSKQCSGPPSILQNRDDILC